MSGCGALLPLAPGTCLAGLALGNDENVNVGLYSPRGHLPPPVPQRSVVLGLTVLFWHLELSPGQEDVQAELEDFQSIVRAGYLTGFFL